MKGAPALSVLSSTICSCVSGVFFSLSFPFFFDGGAPHGMSKLMRSWMAGLIANAAATTYFVAPFVNSYKRFVAGTFAPTKMVWSTDNRTAGFRVVGEGTRSVRVENRVGGADLNP